MMNPEITVFLPYGVEEETIQSVRAFKDCGLPVQITVLNEKSQDSLVLPEGIQALPVSSLFSSDTLCRIAAHSKTKYMVLCIKRTPVQLGSFALHRFIQIAQDTHAAMLYSDYLALKEEQMIANPVIEYQEGSVRDDFNFGSLLFFETAAFVETASRIKDKYNFAGWYDLRLKMSQKYKLFHIPEFLYTEIETDIRKTGEKQFDYVDPKNRQVQIEMEKACTEHLKASGAWLTPIFRKLNFGKDEFPVEASVIIPVKNRVKTITDAIQSVITQKAEYPFNLIIVDNHSTDGTGALINSFCSVDRRIIHVMPQRNDLGIGGCWNEAIFHPSCGKFVIQLDSDDLYIDDSVLARIVNAFHEQNCAMLIGAYKMVNFRLEDIPPGIIDHREWTPENGRNNALRINGLGAPRAFYTPVIRNIRFPNVSYGEDYMLGLNISRYYQIGRIFEPVYLCRRWEENSDASLDIQKLNTYNFYKDKIRTIEYHARQQYILKGQEV